jgi:hypothetical protein
MFTEDQPPDLCNRLINISESGLPGNFVMDSEAALRFRKVKQSHASANVLSALADPRVNNLKKLLILLAPENSSPAVLCNIIKNNPGLNSFTYQKIFSSEFPEFRSCFTSFSNLTEFEMCTPEDLQEQDFSVLGRELRNLLKISGIGSFSKAHLKAFTSEMPDNFPLCIFSFPTSLCLRPRVLGKYLARKCPNLEIARTNGPWCTEGFKIWSTCPCYLRKLTLDDLDLGTMPLSEFLAERGKNLLEISFNQQNLYTVDTAELRILDLQKNCPMLSAISGLDVSDPEVAREYFFKELTNLRRLSFYGGRTF